MSPPVGTRGVLGTHRRWVVLGGAAGAWVRAGGRSGPPRCRRGRAAVRPRLKPYAAEGFPEPINSQGSRIRLYDGEQVDAYLLGKPVPPLLEPEGEDDGDLLDRRECAALLGVAPNSWAIYKRDPVLTVARGEAGGVEHWPRHAVKAFQAARPGRDAACGGRPTRTGDQVPRDTAQQALTRLRADHIEAHPTLTPAEAAAQLDFPAGQVRRANARAETVLRARHIAPYLAGVAAALHRVGWTTEQAAPEVYGAFRKWIKLVCPDEETQRRRDVGPPDSDSDEKSTLLTFLNYVREAVAAKAQGLDDRQGRTPGVPSGTSVLGLLKHLTAAELYWFAWAFEGADVEHPDFSMDLSE
ncbi:mycothiol transferase [Streptomyces rubiginosohelvolus]|uniref:mycothiol transferase n=1 Tax=Streptomyces rubiginosohelvolus TaxID=67362 RepID=UPI0035DE5CA8